jgi:hypothetical protein
MVIFWFYDLCNFCYAHFNNTGRESLLRIYPSKPGYAHACVNCLKIAYKINRKPVFANFAGYKPFVTLTRFPQFVDILFSPIFAVQKSHN